MKTFRFLLIMVGFLMICRGLGDLGLYIFGVQTTATISNADRISSRMSINNYLADYTFTLSDHSLRSGSGIITKGRDESSAFVDIVYYDFCPEYNAPYGSGLVFYFMIWAALGSTFLYINWKRLFKERKQRSKDGASVERNPLIFILPVILLIAIIYHGTKERIAEIGEFGHPGNTIGNSINGGMLLEGEEKLFFINWNEKNRLYSMNPDGTDLRQLTEESVSGLNETDEWIYYSNFNDGSRLYRIRADGSKRSRIYAWESEEVHIAGDYIFLSNFNDHHKLYRLNLEGKAEKRLNDDESSHITVSDGWIYYTNETDGGTLYRIDPNGKNRTKLTDVQTGEFLMESGKIYFANPEDDQKLYSMNTDGTGLALFADVQAAFLNADEHYLYFSNGSDRGRLYRIEKGGGHPEKISDIHAFTISISSEYILTIDFWDTNQLVFMTKDGSVVQLLQRP